MFPWWWVVVMFPGLGVVRFPGRGVVEFESWTIATMATDRLTRIA